MSNLSFFVKRAFLNTSPNTEFVSKKTSYHGRGHLQRVSSMIRGDQIAAHLGAKLNPEKGYENDICIYVKPYVRGEQSFSFQGVQSYVDIIDGWGLTTLLHRSPLVNIIACSQQDYNALSQTMRNHVVCIPQHHCNFERYAVLKTSIKTIGIIGTEDAFTYIPSGLEEALQERGISLLKFSQFFSREDVVDFYKKIDVQLVWRPYKVRLSNPLKIVNAASFGIPTIAYHETVFDEVDECYLGVSDTQEFLKALDEMRLSKTMYREYYYQCLRVAEDYHIEAVAELYKQL